METLTQIVFSENRIATNTLLAKEIDCNIDESNQLLYKFYLKYKERLGTFFIVVRQDGALRIVIERIPEEKLNHLLNEKEYAESILSVKVWALYDKSQGEFDVDHVYEAEEANLHCIQNLCQKFREIDLTKKTPPPIKKSNTMQSDSSQTSTKKSQKDPISKSNTLTEKDKSNNDNKIVEETPQELPTASNPKKRKGGVENYTQEVGKDKDLKKTKLTTQSSLTLEAPKTKAKEVKEIKEAKETKQAAKGTKDSAIEIEDEEESYFGGQIPVQEEKKVTNSQNNSSQKKEKHFEQETIHEVEKPVQTQNKTIERRDSQKHFQEEPIPGSDDMVRVKKVRRVPRDKTYMDAKGYLIVEQEYVDEEYWEVVKKKDLVKSQAPLIQASQKKPIEKSQSTLGSFFKKK